MEIERLGPDATFCFDCRVDRSCLNACCTDLHLVLTPYDVLRLRRRLALPSADFLRDHGEAIEMPQTRFPILQLQMRRSDRLCPWATGAGCTVYRDRPGACRAYPLGRTAQIGDRGQVVEQVVLQREPHCLGFDGGPQWTAARWFENQELAPYSTWADRFSALVARVRLSGRTLNEQQRASVRLALYELDRFREFIKQRQLLRQLRVARDRHRQILDDDEAALSFGFEWLALLLGGLSSDHTTRM
ncbi:MAG: YkgJ family cysteine cluster protein [Deltaproteobacteria bacterium]|nr:YkgJ family cysteine cluster protein [Deltaproteobacteria bacterium]